MTVQVPVSGEIERVFIITVDALRWDFHDQYRELYPDGPWFRGTAQATYTPTSHSSLFTGLNPPRHGVYGFNEMLRTETIFDAIDGLVTSSLVINNDGLKLRAPTTDKSFRFPDFIPDEIQSGEYEDVGPYEPGWQLASGDSTRSLDEVADHDPKLAWFHDWIVHSSGNYGEASWSPTINDVSVATAHDHYRELVDLDIAVHQQFLDELKARGLYENTLFIVWGDHGQSFGEQPFEVNAHGKFTCEASTRVPFGFCSPVFEETAVDRETNVRSVDIPPTLASVFEEAGHHWLGLSHEMEGVDLTTFDGKLAGYTIGGNTLDTGAFDSVRMTEYAYVNQATDMLLETPLIADRPTETTVQTEVDAPHQLQRLKNMYDAVRTDRDHLIVRDETNNDLLEALGYR